MRFTHSGRCHCGSIAVELLTDRAPQDHLLGACQCSFCRKHNARAFSDPKARAVLTAVEADNVHHYRFGLATADVILCRNCGVYVAMLLGDGDDVFSVVNVDVLDDRKAFTGELESRDFDGETTESRIARRKARWTPTALIGWPAPGKRVSIDPTDKNTARQGGLDG
jgi:hypothetical protein